MRMPKGTLKILVEGVCRSKIIDSEQQAEGFLLVSCQDLTVSVYDNDIELEAAWKHLKSLYGAYAKLNSKIPTDLPLAAKTAADIDQTADTIAVHLNLSFNDRQKLLETIDLKERIIKLCTLF